MSKYGGERFNAQKTNDLDRTKSNSKLRNDLGNDSKNRGFLGSVAGFARQLIISDNQLKPDKVKKGEKKQSIDLTRLAGRNLLGRDITRNKKDLEMLRGGIFDLNGAKNSYGMDSSKSVFYYGAGANHFIASGRSLKPSGFNGKRFFG